MSRRKSDCRNRNAELLPSRAQFAQGGNPAHGHVPSTAKDTLPPPSKEDYTLMMTQAMQGRA